MTEKKVGKRKSTQCVVCGYRKSNNFWLCRECAVKWSCYNRSYKEWPEWVKALVRIERLDDDRRVRTQIEVEPREPIEMERLVDKKGHILQ